MKRLVLGLLAALLVTAGLVSASSTTATAACPYTNCIQTSLNSEAKKVIRVGQRPVIKVGVRSAGNVYPTGSVTMRVYRKGTTRVLNRQVKTIRPAERFVSRTTFRLPRLARGKYTIRFNYTPSARSVFKPSTNQRPLTVKPRR